MTIKGASIVNLSKLAQFDDTLLNKIDGQYLAGFDEVANGAIAGPMVCAGVIFPKGTDLSNIKDSKKYHDRSIEHFEELAKIILHHAKTCAIGVAGPKAVDKLGPLNADRLAMRRALSQFTVAPDIIVIDGSKQNLLGSVYPEEYLNKADSQSQAVAAASILATYMSYRIMNRFNKLYPQYHFDLNHGYYNSSTPLHLKALEEIGITPIHRRRYSPVKQHLKDWPIVFGPTNQKEEKYD